MGYISEQIEKMYKDLLFKRQDPDGTIFYFDESYFDGLHSEEFSFKSKRGHRLFGKFYFYEGYRTDRLIIFEHGMGSGHNAYFREIENLCKKGYLVYSYDHTGCYRSEGEHIHGLTGSLSDLDDCINALVNEKGLREEEISIIGHSWGGFSALNILDYHPNIHSIVAMAGFISVKVMHKQTIPFFLAPFRKRLFEIEKKTNPKFADSNAIKVLQKTDRPVLVIHSIDDKTVGFKANFEALSRALIDKTNIQYLLVNGNGHSPHFSIKASSYMSDFFKNHHKFSKEGLLDTDEQKQEFLDSYDWFAMTEQNEYVWNKIFKFLDPDMPIEDDELFFFNK